jgi:CRP-like cAMP-binding protein
VTVKAFGASSVDYLAQFWIADYAVDRSARDQVRTNLWYTFRRHNIEIPWPIQVQYERDEEPVRSESQVQAAANQLASVDLFTPLSPEARHVLAGAATHHLFAAGEAIVRQGAAGDSMFVILKGRVRVTLQPANQELAVIATGGLFGEMSMLTGDARTATVTALEDSVVLEISADDFRQQAMTHDGLLDHISTVMAARRTGLVEARAAAALAISPEAKHTFLARMKRFLTLHT